VAEIRESTHPRELGNREATQKYDAERTEISLRRGNGLLLAVTFSLAAWGGLIALLWFLI